ncbi:gluconokinase [Actinomadura sp. 9N215]|uniref:gluconokinase n=1 Tax=Actinomadura sp. 9N215 TaxID=3375150 RepID=UPI003798C866
MTPRPPGTPPPTVVVIAGVSGSGKTTIGSLLAERLGWDYAEADSFHSEANIEKMRAGHPLTDADRLPWLRAIADWIDDRLATGRPGVVTCSALKRGYRDLVAGGRPGVRVVLLDGDRDLIAARMRARKDHYFSADLLDSQFADLELPGPDEDVLTAPVTGPPEETVARLRTALGLSPSPDTCSPQPRP